MSSALHGFFQIIDKDIKRDRAQIQTPAVRVFSPASWYSVSYQPLPSVLHHPTDLT